MAGLTETSEPHLSRRAGTSRRPSDSYLERPGFWHGAIGIAACWYGGAGALAEELQRSLLRRNDAHGRLIWVQPRPHCNAARAGAAHAAKTLDADPQHDARALALATRAIVEQPPNQCLITPAERWARGHSVWTPALRDGQQTFRYSCDKASRA